MLLALVFTYFSSVCSIPAKEAAFYVINQKAKQPDFNVSFNREAVLEVFLSVRLPEHRQ
jgi:hypothetical protein